MSGWCSRRINKDRHVRLISINFLSLEGEAIFFQRTSTQSRKELNEAGDSIFRVALFTFCFCNNPTEKRSVVRR
jgi:hypothetical protein